MTRTGTLAFLSIALLATLLSWTGTAVAQSLTQSAGTGAGWIAQEATEYQPSPRRADSSTATWKPTRSEAAQLSKSAVAPTAPERNWLLPTQAAGRAKTRAAKPNPNGQAKRSAIRAPKPFVPPTDAAEIPAAKRPGPKVVEAAASAAAPSQPRANVNTSAARTSRPAVHANGKPSQYTRLVGRSQNDRASSRPRPTPTKGSRLIDDSWIRPLKQVAYQSGEPEELYAPPGEEVQLPMPGSPMLGPELPSDGEWIGAPGCDESCGPMCGDDVGCCATCGREPESCSIDLAPGLHDPEACQEVRFRVPRINTLMVNGGVHGFKGPFDRDRNNGNFGFQEGVNFGLKVPLTHFGYQIGFQSTQSQLSGDANAGVTDAFSQQFITAGVFQRNYDGFQGGIVWDWMLDERDSSVTFSQLRGELGFVDCGCHEVGGSIAVHLRDNTFSQANGETVVLTTFRSVDQYLLYYRKHGPHGGEGRVYAGLTDGVDGLIGADFLVPLTDCWSLQPGFTYLIPEGGGGTVGAREEAWNIGINLVWHWKGQARSCHSSPYRPLFNVADNGSMIIDHRP